MGHQIARPLPIGCATTRTPCRNVIFSADLFWLLSRLRAPICFEQLQDRDAEARQFQCGGQSGRPGTRDQHLICHVVSPRSERLELENSSIALVGAL
jgi:hypothetical protein